jgi:hypothetical protein
VTARADAAAEGAERSIRLVRRTPVLPLAVALVLALPAARAHAASDVVVLDSHGRAHVLHDRFVPSGDALAPGTAGVREPAPRALARAAAAKRTVPGELDALLASGAIDQAHHDDWRAAWKDARGLLPKLHGVRRANLAAVISNTAAIAADGLLSATRAPGVFLTLQRNRQWWASGPLLSYGRRVGFTGSELVWQFYPGQGIQLQWLATFGKANALFAGRVYDDRLRALLDEAVGLATQRAGGLSWDYLLRFDGGRPPWTSSLSQGTAIQALSRAAVRLGQSSYFEVARQALGVFREPPPAGVRAATPVGAHYLQYSFAPTLHIINGFLQSLNGLHDFSVLANDPEGRALFAAGEAQARVEVPAFDTGSWSLYLPGKESDLSYHVLVRDFLRGLCTRLQEDAARDPAIPAPDPAVYCDKAQSFTDDLTRPPVVELPDARGRAGSAAKIPFTLSKISTVTATVLRKGAVVWSHTARMGYGPRTLSVRPAKAGPLEVRLRAVDLAGNVGTTTGTLHVARATRKGAAER